MKRILWTDKQKEIYQLLIEGKSYEDLRAAEYGCENIDIVTRAIRRGESPPRYEVPPVPKNRPPEIPLSIPPRVRATLEGVQYAFDLVKMIKGEIDRQVPRAHAEICPVCQGKGGECNGCPDGRGWVVVR